MGVNDLRYTWKNKTGLSNLPLVPCLANLNSSEENDEDEEEDEDEGGIKQMNLNKYGVGGINRPNQRPNLEHSLCPIHFAIEADEKVR